MYSKVGKALWKWVQNVAFPEEIFFNTLVRIDKKNPFMPAKKDNSMIIVRQGTKIIQSLCKTLNLSKPCIILELYFPLLL